jgi:hypothetical protein
MFACLSANATCSPVNFDDFVLSPPDQESPKRPIFTSSWQSSFLGQGNVTDITYVPTHEGWPYLAVVIDLFLWPWGYSIQSRTPAPVSEALWIAIG